MPFNAQIVQINLKQYIVNEMYCFNQEAKREFLSSVGLTWFEGSPIRLSPKKHYNEIYELNFGHEQLKYRFHSLVPDSVFFNFEDKELALSRVDEFTRNYLIGLDYTHWSSDQTLEYLIKRIQDRK